MKKCAITTGKIIAIVIIMLALTFIGVVLAATIQNERCRISEGVIIDKQLNEGYTQGDISKNGGNYVSVPTTYYFQLRGEKNDKTVTYWLNVAEDEYSEYKVGDYYKK